MNKLARFSIVLLSIILLFSCLTDPVEMPKGETPSPVEPETKPDEKPEVTPDPQPVKPKLDLDPCDELPSWLLNRKFKVVEGNLVVIGKGIVDLKDSEYIVSRSIYNMDIPEGAKGYSITTDNNYHLQYTFVKKNENTDLLTHISEMKVDKIENGIKLIYSEDILQGDKVVESSIMDITCVYM